MKCPNCERPLPAGKARCLYCGAEATSAETVTPSDSNADDPLTPPDGSPSHVRLDDLPEELRQQVVQALHSAKTQPAVEEAAPADTTRGTAGADRMHRVTKALESIQQRFNDDRIDYDEYRELVLHHLKRFLEGLDPKAALGFVLNDLKSSDLGRFIDDAIYKSLCSAQLSATVPPVEKTKTWTFGIFRKRKS
jgi:hypothetical protein